MPVGKDLTHFWKTFSYPKVMLFIISGTGIIFLTFLTRNNALEIVISGLASIFLGIGINNFSSLETRHKDEMIIKKRVEQELQVLNLIENKIRQIQQDYANGDRAAAQNNYAELISQLSFLQGFLREEEWLK